MTLPTDPDQLASACAGRMWAQDRYSQKLGMTIECVNEGKAIVCMTVSGDMVNGHHICHGGAVFALADSAFAFACNSQNQIAVAANCSVDFIRPAKEGDNLVATAVLVHQGKRNGIYDVTVVNQQKRVIAQFRGRSTRLEGSVISEKS